MDRRSGSAASSSSRGSATTSSSYLSSAATQSAAITIGTRQTLTGAPGATFARSSSSAVRPHPFVSGNKITSHYSSVPSSANGTLGQHSTQQGTTWQQPCPWTAVSSSSISQDICTTQMYQGSGRVQLSPSFMSHQQYNRYYPTSKTTRDSSVSVYGDSDSTQWSTEARDDTSSQCSSLDGQSDNQTHKSSVPSYSSSSTRSHHQSRAQPAIGHGGKVVPETTFRNLRAVGGSHMARALPNFNMYRHRLVAPVVVPEVGTAPHVFHHPQQQSHQPSSATMRNAVPNRGTTCC